MTTNCDKGTAFSKQVGGDHYRSLAIQPTEYCHKNRLGFCESSVVKYVTRHRAKNGRQDLEKAIHFLHLLIEMEYPDGVGAELASFSRPDSEWRSIEDLPPIPQENVR